MEKSNILKLLINNDETNIELAYQLCLSIKWYEGILFIKKLLGLNKIPLHIFKILIKNKISDSLLEELYSEETYENKKEISIKEAKELGIIELFSSECFLKTFENDIYSDYVIPSNLNINISTYSDYLYFLHLLHLDKEIRNIKLDRPNFIKNAIIEKDYEVLFSLNFSKKIEGYFEWLRVKFLEEVKKTDLENYVELYNFVEKWKIYTDSNFLNLSEKNIFDFIEYGDQKYLLFCKDNNLLIFEINFDEYPNLVLGEKLSNIKKYLSYTMDIQTTINEDTKNEILKLL